MSLYSHIVKVKYIKLEVPRKTFNHIFRGKTKEVLLDNTEEWRKKVAEPNEFIRITNADWYMDLSIKSIEQGHHICITLDKKIDFNKPDNIQRCFKKKK